MEAALVFTVGLATMLVAHEIQDHVFGQTDHQAANKMKPGFSGWSSNLLHIFDYHVGMLLMLMLTFWITDLPLSGLGLVVALGFSAITHAILDRRWPVKWILEHTGSPEFSKMKEPLVGMYLADQSLHKFCLWISALLLTLL